MEEARWTSNDNIGGGQPVPNKPYLKLTTRVNLVAENGWIILSKGVVPIGSSVTIRAKVRPHTSSFTRSLTHPIRDAIFTLTSWMLCEAVTYQRDMCVMLRFF